MPHQRNPYALKFEAENILTLREKDKTTFFSPTEVCAIRKKTRGKIICCGFRIINAHAERRKDLNSAELETVRVSESPTTVVAANGEVQTHGEAAVYVKELDLFLTEKLLEDTPAVLSLGKLWLFQHSYTHISNISIAGSGSSYIASRINKK